MLRTLVVGVLLSAVLAMASNAAVIEDEIKLERLARNCPLVHLAVVYARTHSDLPIPSRCPTLTFEVGDPGVKGRASDPTILRLRGASYFHETDTILMSPIADLRSTEGMGAMIHLVVHLMQDVSGEYELHDCRAALEQQAYAIEAQFHEDSGNPERAAQLRREGDLRSHCLRRRGNAATQ